MIGGNTNLIIYMPEEQKSYDENGKSVQAYKPVASLFGWLDMSTGDSKYDYKAKIEDSTHIFICDYSLLGKIDIEKAKAEVLDVTTYEELTTADFDGIRNLTYKDFAGKGEMYDIKYIDDPMGLHQHLEIYLKRIGGQNE